MHTSAVPVTTLPAAELLTVRRGCHQVTPYQAGYEDARYDHEYHNPYRPGTQAYTDYDRGVQDAGRQTARGWL